VVTVEKNRSTINTLPSMIVPAYEEVALKRTWMIGYWEPELSRASRSVMQKLGQVSGVSGHCRADHAPECYQHHDAHDTVSEYCPHHGLGQLQARVFELLGHVSAGYAHISFSKL